MLTKYKKSFEETLGAEGEGANVKCVGGILKQMKDKFDNMRRKTTARQPQTRMERQRPPIKEAYGCIRWEVVDYPDGEDKNSLEEKKLLLQEHYKNRRTRGAVDPREIKELMEVTYKLQRELINSNVRRALEQQRLRRRSRATQAEETDEQDEDEPTVTFSVIRKEYPFLFSYVGMEIHHELLTGIHATTALDSFCNNDCDRMLQYFGTSKNPLIQSIGRKVTRQLKREGCNEAFVKLLGLIWMVAVEFKENIDSLIKLVPEDTDLNTFDETTLVPEPHLLAAGESLLATQKFFLCIDQHFMAFHTNIIQTIGCLYMPYFIFNLNYPASAQVTMEFIQSPEKGHKRPASRAAGGHFSSAPMHPVVARLLRDINDFLKAKETVTSDDE